MRLSMLGRSFGFLTFLAPLSLLAASCASTRVDDAATSDDGGPTTNPGTARDGGGGGGGSKDSATSADGAKPPPPNDCKLNELTGNPDVTPEFLVYQPPGTAPPATTGGTLNGSYRVDKATVYLPTSSNGLVDPKKSTGTINAWAVFSGTNYRLYLKADFNLSTGLGPQMLGSAVASQGGYTVQIAALTLDHACDAKLPDEADYTFTDTGVGHATILIKQGTMYGDTYLQLDAVKD